MFYFIVNEHGRNGEAIKKWRETYKSLSESGRDFRAFLTKGPADACEIASKIAKSTDADPRIIVVGGDGTFNEVLNGIPDFDKVKLGLIPLGSANDFAGSLGLVEEPNVSLKRIFNCREAIKIDLGKVTFDGSKQRIFAISAGIGWDALICKKIADSRVKKIMNKVGMGEKSYIALAAQSLLDFRYINTSLEFDGKEKVKFDKMLFTAFMNMPLEGGGVAMVPDAGYDDGYISMCCAHGCEKSRILLALIKLVSKKHLGDKSFSFKDFKKVRVQTDVPVCFHTDGEYLGDVTDITVECLYNKLQFLM